MSARSRRRLRSPRGAGSAPSTILVNNAGTIAPLGDLHETNPPSGRGTFRQSGRRGCGCPCRAAGDARGSAWHDRQHLVRAAHHAACRLERVLRGEGRPRHADQDARRGIFRRGSGSSASRRVSSIRLCRRRSALPESDPSRSCRARALTSPREPAEAIAFLARLARDRFAGQELDVRNRRLPRRLRPRAACCVARRR